MKKYSVATPERLRSLCFRKQWFTHGTRELEEYLIDVADEMVANGERTADEIYCGYFD